jgi:AbrB family looped-hinge helix DNA binding protein
MVRTPARTLSSGRTVIPKAVRERLRLKTGDLIRLGVGDKGAVRIEKVKPVGDGRFASFGEWTSEEDEKLYRGL